jgi:hypothetical protein
MARLPQGEFVSLYNAGQTGFAAKKPLRFSKVTDPGLKKLLG